MSSQSTTLVPIPGELREFMSDVADGIQTRDESATLYSDDLLQCERGYGGRVAKKEFVFVYFPNDSERWEPELKEALVRELRNFGRKPLYCG